jgi:hypothetical protein
MYYGFQVQYVQATSMHASAKRYSANIHKVGVLESQTKNQFYLSKVTVSTKPKALLDCCWELEHEELKDWLTETERVICQCQSDIGRCVCAEANFFNFF